ncbi:tetratricopeptide repeat protein [Pseudooceanicola aestuarii]|uniref:tetratricopeptide repeat protein n=1 Tax=Pseudooceanicola aestuarii TaxID=2697319 RepID=UPI001EF94C41|nr:tetratricopeptide repeat protein [Pseudooceanicola aestuarii]
MKALRFAALAAAMGMAAQTAPVQAQGNAGSYLAARQARLSSDYDAAVHYYLRALGKDSNNAKLLESMVLSQIAAGETPKAVPVAQRMEKGERPSQIAHMALVAEEVRAGAYDAVLARLEEGRGIGPLVDGLIAAWVNIGKGDMQAALTAYNGVADQKGLTRFALYHKALALGYVGDFEAAEAIYEGTPDQKVQMTRRGAMARIEVLSQLDRNDDALHLIETLFGSDLDPALQAIRAALAAGDTLPYTHVTSISDGVAEVFYSVAAALQTEASHDYTLLYSRVAEYLRPDHIDALLLSAGLLEKMDHPDLATRTYRRVPRDNPAFHAAELGRADALRKAGKVDAAIEVMQQLAVSHGQLPVVHSTLGDLYRQQGHHIEAVAAYDKALGLYPQDDSSRWFVHYARGISNERLNHWDSAETDFRRALELNPGQPQVLNYLGYSLVEKDRKLDEALTMIERAANVRPDSGYIMDSLGWVLYRLGRYEEAVGHMERATELMPVDPIVNDHLGDVYWAVGRAREAEFQWNRALSFAPEDADAERIRRKLKVGLDAVLADEGAEPLQVARDGG